MSNGIVTTVGDVVRVLVVGESTRMESAADALAAGLESASLLRARTAADAGQRLANEDIHCVLCEFRPEEDRSPLETLAATVDDRPILAVTDDETAARALEAGATDVVAPGTNETVLVTRVRNAADCYRRTERTDDHRHRALVESIDAPIWLLEADGTIADASPAVESRLGYTSGELERTKFERLVHPDDRPAVRETLRTVATQSFGATEGTTVRLGDADERWQVVELTCVNRLEEPPLEGIVATATALAPATAAAENLQAAIDRLERPLFTVGPDWELQWSNAAADRLFVDAPATGTVVWTLLPERVRETFLEHLREARATGEVVRFEIAGDVANREGTPLALAAYPDGDGVTVLARERDAMPSSEERDRLDLLESTVDALEDGIAIVDDSSIEFANATLVRMAGRNALVGREVDDLFDDDLATTVLERAESSIVRWMEPVQGRFVAGDASIDVDVYVSPLRNEPDRTLCLVRDRRRSAAGALSTVHRTVAALQRAEAAADVRRAVVDAVHARTDADLAVWYLVDDDRLRPAAVATDDASPTLEPPPVERDSSQIPLEDGIAVADGSTLEPFLERAGITAERVLTTPVGSDGIVLATSTEPMAFESLERDRDRESLTTIVDAASIALERIAGRTRVRRCEQERSRLETALDDAKSVRAVERRLLEAETREDVERRLCEGIVSLAETIELAWVGRVDAESVTPRTWAGRDDDVLEGLSVPVDPDADEPTGKAAARREPIRVDDLERSRAAVDDSRADERRVAEAGFRSLLSVPIERDRNGIRYGTLTAYADRPSAFDEHRQALFEHLAAVAAHAIGALERKRALLSDGVVELEVVLRDESEPLSAFVRQLGQQVEVRAVVPRSSGGSTLYCTRSESDGEPTAMQTVAESVAGIESIRSADDGVDDSPIELVFSASTVAETVATHGGVVRSMTPDDDRVRLVIDLSSTVDVRAFVETLERAYSGVELVARRERRRTARPARPFDAELRDRLSERQLRTLESAYYGGFFEWPRESTGEEVADSLGVSQPTFSRHLRLAQGKLFELLFEDRSATLE
ncbi:bacterio-opsin activator domain-containing protein [Natronobacterium texcoconense]|uniref:PAS domain S-box-containing protein n=1 Tax=Natronobacterium texcoconense TaxID=1095778 RepID=A0A1H1EZE3_NATTX|nr:bacterio-opsin activator domain-containing protein [Natronobacterium texcoconense]SDQ94125.1 PAS domain S-box-containing protein [Natronobacterium texcoconense]